MNTDTGSRIKKIREYRSYTQSYMAAKLNIRQNTYSKIESGITAIKLQRLEKIAKILDVSVDNILNGDIQLFNLDIKKDGSNKNVIEHLEMLMHEVQGIKEQNDIIINALSFDLKNKVRKSVKNKKVKK